MSFRTELRNGQPVVIRTMSPEHRAKLAALAKARVRTPAHNKKISDAKKRWWADPNNRLRQSAAMRKVWAPAAQAWDVDSRGLPNINLVVGKLMYCTPEVRSAWTQSTPAELAAHLEAQFLPGMTWDNVDKWRLTWITVPNPLRPELFAAALHYRNLRPVWLGEAPESTP